MNVKERMELLQRKKDLEKLVQGRQTYVQSLQQELQRAIPGLFGAKERLDEMNILIEKLGIDEREESDEEDGDDLE